MTVGTPQRRPRIAAIVTQFFENSHADVILSKFACGCDYPGAEFRPEVEITALYLDQTPPNELGIAFAREESIPVFPTIAEALCLGDDAPAVDGILLIGEHGDYPINEKAQQLYPRRRFFEETVAVIRPLRGRVPLPPVFSDKHLSTHSWSDAKWMVDTARELGIPFMAGSSLPLTWRRPPLEYDLGVELEEALVVGYGGLNSYGFHALETLQCMVERRRGGETGVAAVQCLSGTAVWEAGGKGILPVNGWSRDLLDAALARGEKVPPGSVEENAKEPLAILIEYRDGLRASVLMLDGCVAEFLFAARRAGASSADATLFWLQEPKPYAHFARLSAAVQKMFLTRQPTYPVERTLLTTGILLAAHDSLHAGGRRVETPELDVTYHITED